MQHTLCSIVRQFVCYFRSCRIACEIAGMVWHCCHNDRLSKTVDSRAKKSSRTQKVFTFNTACFVGFFLLRENCIFSHDDTMNKQTDFLLQTPRVHIALTCLQLHVEIFSLNRNRTSTCFTVHTSALNLIVLGKNLPT